MKTDVMILGVLVGLSSCAIDDSEMEETPTSQVEQDALLSSARIWPTRYLRVCSMVPGVDTEMEWVRQAIESSWASEAGVKFKWDFGNNTTCAQLPTAHIRIDFKADPQNPCGQSSSIVGTDALQNTATASMTLHRCLDRTDAERKREIQRTSVHEFGHALSFLHEHSRSDAGPGCQGQLDWHSPGVGNTVIGSYDQMSTMDYCSESGNNAGRLSGTDIYAATNYYGDEFPFAMVITTAFDMFQFARLNGPSAPATEGGNVFYRQYIGSYGWSGWFDLGNSNGHAPSSAPAAVGDSSRQRVFVRSSTGTLAYLDKRAGGPGWVDLGGTVVGKPTAVMAGRRIVVFVRNSNYGLSIKEWNATQWLSWLTIANPTAPVGSTPSSQYFTGAPQAVVGQDGSINVFVRWSDGTIRTLRSTTAGVWPTTWTNLGGNTLGSPAVVAWKNASNSLKVVVFARSAVSNDINYIMQGQSGSWGGWSYMANMSSGTSGSLSAVSLVNDGAIYVFGRDATNGSVMKTELWWNCVPSPFGPLCDTFPPGTWTSLPYPGVTGGSPMAFPRGGTGNMIEVYTGNTTRTGVQYFLGIGQTWSVGNLPISIY